MEVSPPEAAAGQLVTLVGSAFGSDPARVAVTFDGIPGAVVSVSPGSIVARVPPGVPAGTIRVEVTVGGSGTISVGLTILATAPPFQSISAGSGFTCGVLQSGGAHCWGVGVSGQLGTGTGVPHSTRPLPVSGGSSFTVVSAGGAHACGIDGAGVAYCWGGNDSGQLGDGTAGSRSAPVPVGAGLAFRAISAGLFHTCGLTADGGLYCWGRNRSGELGDGTTATRFSPVAVLGDHGFVSVSAGGSHTCGVTDSGIALCWGENGHGELGNGTLTDSSSPVPVAGGQPFAQVSAGRAPAVARSDVGEHTCALTLSGEAQCWGFNSEGQLGDGTRSETSIPVRVATGARFMVISAGAFHTCAVATDRRGMCWGANDSGQLGTRIANPSLAAPVDAAGDLELVSITASGAGKTNLFDVRGHSCGLAHGGTAFCWGRNSSGQLGNGSVTARSVPLPVTSPSGLDRPAGPG